MKCEICKQNKDEYSQFLSHIVCEECVIKEDLYKVEEILKKFPEMVGILSK